MTDSAVIVALIGLLGILSGHIVSRLGKRAENQQKALADRAADEHQRFEERGELIADLRIEVDRARAHRDDAEQDLRLSEDENRRLRSDLAALAAIVRDEVAREALRTAHDIQVREGPRTSTEA